MFAVFLSLWQISALLNDCDSFVYEPVFPLAWWAMIMSFGVRFKYITLFSVTTFTIITTFISRIYLAFNASQSSVLLYSYV